MIENGLYPSRTQFATSIYSLNCNYIARQQHKCQQSRNRNDFSKSRIGIGKTQLQIFDTLVYFNYSYQRDQPLIGVLVDLRASDPPFLLLNIYYQVSSNCISLFFFHTLNVNYFYLFTISTERSPGIFLVYEKAIESGGARFVVIQFFMFVTNVFVKLSVLKFYRPVAALEKCLWFLHICVYSVIINNTVGHIMLSIYKIKQGYKKSTLVPKTFLFAPYLV